MPIHFPSIGFAVRSTINVEMVAICVKYLSKNSFFCLRSGAGLLQTTGIPGVKDLQFRISSLGGLLEVPI
jgi:hypothetical protein